MSLATLWVLDGTAGDKEDGQGDGQGIERCVSGNSVYISRLNRFTASFYARGYGVDPI